MSQLQFWTLEQSILGCGKKTHGDATREQLLAWARSKEPSESVPSLAWRTELALVYLHAGQRVFQDRSLQCLIKALGYRVTDEISGKHAVQFGGVPLGVGDCTQINSLHRRCSFKTISLTLGVVWSWHPAQRLTKGIIYGTDQRGWRKMYRVLNGIRQHTYLRTNPVFLGLMSLRAEVHDQVLTMDDLCARLEVAQIKTGRHGYTNYAQNLDTRGVDWAELSSYVCGSAVNLSTCTMCVRTLLKLADFIVEESNAMCKGDSQLLKQAGLPQSLQASNNQISSLARQYRLRLDSLLQEAQSFQWEAEILVQTVFTLATQRDQEVSIEIARDSKTLAQQATKDSTSMKSIAAVTMFFLPGTFVAVSYHINLLEHVLIAGIVTLRHAYVCMDCATW